MSMIITLIGSYKREVWCIESNEMDAKFCRQNYLNSSKIYLWSDYYLNKKLIKKILFKVDAILFREKFKNLYILYLKERQRKIERRLERKSVSYKSDLFNYGFSVHYSKNENAQINKLCDKYGTDKGETKTYNHPYDGESHNYADFYEMLFRCRRKDVRLLIECGLGTNDIKFNCHMGINGKPGASLRMWRDFFPSARVIGVDIDKKILFNEERIETYYCDQLNSLSIEKFAEEANLLENSADIIIDDGFHCFKAGISFFEGMIKFLNQDGIYVIEDINPIDYFSNDEKSSDMYLYKDYFSKLTKKYTVHFIEGKRPNNQYAKNNRLILIFKNNVKWSILKLNESIKKWYFFWHVLF